MFYQTRQLVSTMDQRFGNHFLTKGQPFNASGVDAEYLLRAKKAKLPEAVEQEPPAASEPKTAKFLDFVNDPRVPGLDNLQDVLTPAASNDAQTDGNTAALVQTTDTGASVHTAMENGSEPAKTDEPEPAPAPAAVPRRTITRRSVNQ